MVQGKFFGSPNFVAPEATNNCGTFFEFMYFWMAEFDSVPSDWKIKKNFDTTSSFHSLRVRSFAFLDTAQAAALNLRATRSAPRSERPLRMQTSRGRPSN